MIAKRSDYSKLTEAYVSFFYSNFVNPGDTVIDAGLNWGMHFYPLADIVGESGLVVGIEANAKLAQRAMQRIEKEKRGNCQVIAKAVSDYIGQSEFVIYPEQLGLSHLDHSGPNHPSVNSKGEIHTVDVIKLDDLQLPHVSFIKSDLEGGDFRALRGASRLLEKDRPTIVFETIPHINAIQHGFTAAEFFAYFDSLGYLLFDIHGHPFDHQQWLESERTIYWELVAIHKTSSIIGPWFIETARFWKSCVDWPLIEDWGTAPVFGRSPPSLMSI